MAFKIQRPILIGGLGLTFSLWVLEYLHPTTTSLSSTAVWGAIALGSGIWWLRRQTQKSSNLAFSLAKPVNRAAVEQELTLANTFINQLTTEITHGEAEVPGSILDLRQRLAQLTADLDRTQIRLSIMGGKGVGKTTLTRLLAANWTTPAPSVATPHTTGTTENTVGLGATDTPEVHGADLVLFITTGDLTDSEFQAVEQLLKRQQGLLLVFNKQDQYLPAERLLILQHLRDRLHNYLTTEDVVAIAAHPSTVKVRQHQPDGAVQERLEQPAPDVAPLKERLDYLLTENGQQLILATVMRQALALKSDILATLNQVRRDRALPLIEQSQWIAAATAFANPVPSLDLLATAAINAQLVVGLGAIYHQQFSLDQAKTVAGTLADQMVKLGLVELASQAIAPLLKSNAVTYVAGGLLQGVSAAYLTRLAGLTLLAYFEERSQYATPGSGVPFQLDRLTQKLQVIFQENQRTAFLQGLVKQGMNHLLPNTSPVAVE